MKTFLRTILPVICSVLLAVSCTKDDPSKSISGTWAVQSKNVAYENPTYAQRFKADMGYIIFSDNTVTFRDYNNKKVLGKGTFTYSVTSVTKTKKYPEGKVYEGTITFSGVPIKGGSFTRQVINEEDSMAWTDIDGLYFLITHRN